MIFTCDDEGTDKETVKFKMIEVDDEWTDCFYTAEYSNFKFQMND